MIFSEFLERVINDGIEAAKADYSKPEDDARLKGSIAGFEMCRNKTPNEIYHLFLNAQKEIGDWWMKGAISEVEQYWYLNCKMAEIEWVANVISAILISQGERPIVIPTARGHLKAAEILGVYNGKL